MEEATSIKALISFLWWCVCYVCVCVHSDEWCDGVGAYHERERLCPEGVRVVEIAHVHYVSRLPLCAAHAYCLQLSRLHPTVPLPPSPVARARVARQALEKGPPLAESPNLIRLP